MFPIIFETRYFTLNTLWVFFAISIFTATYYFIKISVKNGLKVKFINDHSFALLVGILVGARVFGVIQNYKAYFLNPGADNIIQLFRFWDGGLNGWGGIFGALIVLYLICKRDEQSFLRWTDSLIPATIAGLAIYHLGTFFDGRNYGHETSLPWGVNFENITVKYAVPIHPTQTYATLYSIAITILLIALLKKPEIRKDKRGVITFAGIFLYSFCRFLEEFLRGDDVIMLFNFRISQIAALASAIFAGIFLYIRYNQTSK